MSHTIFISHSDQDLNIADELFSNLEKYGLRCWIAYRDILSGTSWGDSILNAIKESKIFIVILSDNSINSAHVNKETSFALSEGKHIIPYIVGNIKIRGELLFHLPKNTWVQAKLDSMSNDVEKIINIIKNKLPNDSFSEIKEINQLSVERKSRGYVFISYVRSDTDFVEKIRDVLKTKQYGYWDYSVTERDYHGQLYRELEERIDGAVAFITIVSDSWRESDWVASEFIYARERKTPIFVIQAKHMSRPIPILLNLQTRIDMSGDFRRGANILIEELSKKGL